MSITPERSEYLKGYYKKNKERIAAYKADWAKSNPDKVKANQKRYREEHREELQIRQKANREKNDQGSPLRYLKRRLDRIKKKENNCAESAKAKFQHCDLTLDYLMKMWDSQKGQCALTKKTMAHQFHCLFSVSIDRIDSSKGYVKGNVQLVCQAVNYAKNKFSNEEFLNFWLKENNNG